MTLPVHEWAKTIAGSGGGKKGGGSGGGGVEQPNSLRSKQLARVVDLLSEGPIHGVQSLQDIWFDGVVLQNPNGTLNFNSLAIEQVVGWPDQALLPGFPAQEAETAVGLQVKYGTPVIRAISDTNTDRARITVSVPSLQHVKKDSGSIVGTTVQFLIYVQSDGGGWIDVGGVLTITGKTNTRYQRAYSFPLPGTGPWQIRVDRLTADSAVVETQNDLFFDSYTAIIDAKVNYTLSACVGSVIDAEQFQAIPKRTYRAYGLYVYIPTNYDPWTRTYAGVWDGNFQLQWSNNPAWVLFSLLMTPRYGLGQFMPWQEMDKWAFYRIAQWCDQLVPNGKGGVEPRFVCNAVVRDQQEAFDLINAFAALFRGFIYWSGGALVPVADMPADPVGQYSNANVVDGLFTYAGADIRARHTMAHVSWNDPDNLGEPRISVVEDQEGVSKYGIQKLDIIAIGCTSEGQAIRTGKWALFSEQYESETVTFRCGLDSAWARPGDVIQIADANVGGHRMGGRIVEGYTDHIVVDSPVAYWSAVWNQVSCVMPDGSVETRPAHSYAGATSINVAPQPFSAAPLPDSIWVLTAVELQASMWRVLTITEPEPDTFEMTALPYNPTKWQYIEQNLVLGLPDITEISLPVVTDLKASDYLVALSSVSIGVRMLVSWISKASTFEVSIRPLDGNWTTVRTSQLSHDVETAEATYDIWVTPLNSLGQRGVTAKLVYTVIGRTAPPADPKNFRVQAVEGIALFQWAPATDLDVIIGGSYEMRYSPRTEGASWTASNTVVTSIPGTATTVELPYRPGTYLLRTRDITGLFSTNAAVIVTSGPDTAYRPFYRICEHPGWAGDKWNTEIRLPQEWLVLGITGGLWDEQAGNVDDWPDVDMLPEGPLGPAPGEGTYDFFNRIDMGGVFPTRLAVDMLAFPLVESDVFVDERIGLVDDWQDWDDARDAGSGMVTIRMRQTDDDPSSPAARWTNWTQFLAGEYTGRSFEFQAWMSAPSGENIAIEELCVTADLSAKQEQGADVAWVPNKMYIAYTVKFYQVPAISIAIQQGVVGDTFRITNKTREGFDLELINGAGAIITAARTFDWIAQGY